MHSYGFEARTGELFLRVPRPPLKLPSPPPLWGWGRGFGRGGRGHLSLAPSPKNLLHYLAPLKPGRGVLLWGGHLRALTATAALWGVARRSPVLVVDAANRFDPYQLVREAAARKIPPQEALTGVRVARAFTSHQLVRLLTETFPAIPEPGSLVLVLGPVSLFYDEQVPLSERRRLFQDLVRLLARIKTGSALLLLQPRLPRAAANQHFGVLLAPVIDYFVEVECPEGNRRAAPGASEPPAGRLWDRGAHAAPSRVQKGDL
jgi:hypothetical protein